MVADNTASRERRVGVDAGFAARCLLRQSRWASLATQSEGQPFASLVTHAVAPDGAVLMLLSAMAAHCRHLTAEPRCALMATGAPDNLNWHTAPRITVTGRAARLDDRDTRRFWVARHPYARLYADFSDFSVWQVIPDSGLFIAGFGQIANVAAADLACPAGAVAALAAFGALPDADATRLAHRAGSGGRWQLLGIDPDGLDLTQDETVLRIAFPAPVQDAAGARAALRRLLA
jgi:putative heme iron utilization protein